MAGWKYLAIGAVLSVCALAHETVKTVLSGRAFASGSRVPVMSNGYLLAIDNSPVVSVYKPSGETVFTAEVKGPSGLRPHSISDAAADEHGQTVISFVYVDPGAGYQGAIALLDRTGKQTRVFPTGMYMPSHVCFDSAGSIWTVGWQRDTIRRDSEDRDNYPFVRRFDTQGRQTGAFVQRSSFPAPGLSPGGAFGGRWGIRASGDHIGMILFSGRTSERMIWLELDMSGKETGRWTLPPDHTDGLAFAGTELFAVTSRYDKDRRLTIWRLNRLDRNSAEWAPVVSKEIGQGGLNDGFGVLMGTEGEHLVLAKQSGLVFEYLMLGVR